MLARFAPPGFLLSRDGVLLHIFGDASRHIELRPGMFSHKIADMLPRELALVVANGLGAPQRVQFVKFRRSIKRQTETGERIEIVASSRFRRPRAWPTSCCSPSRTREEREERASRRRRRRRWRRR